MTLDPAINQKTGASSRRYRGITLTCERVEFGAIVMPTGSMWTSNNYMQMAWVSWSSSSSLRQWEPAWDRGLEPSGLRLNSPAEWGRSAAIVRGTWVQYVAVCSVSDSPLTHNLYQLFRNPFKNKVWEVYLSKEVCSFVHYCWLCYCMYMYTYSCIMVIQQWLSI